MRAPRFALVSVAAHAAVLALLPHISRQPQAVRPLTPIQLEIYSPLPPPATAAIANTAQRVERHAPQRHENKPPASSLDPKGAVNKPAASPLDPTGGAGGPGT